MYPFKDTSCGFMLGSVIRRFQSPRYGLGPCLDTPPSIGQGVFDRKCRSGCRRLKMDGESGVRVEEVLVVASSCLSGSSRQGGARQGLWEEGRWPMACSRKYVKREASSGLVRKSSMSANG